MTESSRRHIELVRDSAHRFTATNARGGTVRMSTGDDGDTDFTPVELLLAAIAGCSAIDVDYITEKRGEPTSFEVSCAADKVRDDDGNHLRDVEVSFRVTFAEGPEGDAARAMLPKAVQMSHDRLCTVSRTVALPTNVTSRVE